MSAARRALGAMRAAWQRVLAFTAQREAATSMALCRIFVSTTLGLHMLWMLTSGAAVFTFTDAPHGGLAVRTGWLIDLLGGSTPAVITLLSVVCMLAAFAAALGVVTRPMIFVASSLFRLLCGTTVDAHSAYDTLLVNILFMVMLSGSASSMALDAWMARRFAFARTPAWRLVTGVSESDGDIARWPRMLLVLQIGLLYGGSALMKASSGWVPGGDADALWYILHQPMWARFGDVPAWAYPLTQIATTSVWCWELMGPLFVVAVWAREAPPDAWLARSLLGRALRRIHFRELYLLVGIAMHLGIEVSMEVGAFTGASLSLYFCALPPSTWKTAGARLIGSRWAGSRSRSPS